MTIDMVKPYVYAILRDIPESRDDDFLLTIHVYVKMGFAKKLPTGIMIDYKHPEFDTRPAWETITRCRREIQQPTTAYAGEFKSSKQIQLKRTIRAEEFRERYSGEVIVETHNTKGVKAQNQANSWMMAG